MTDPCSRPDCVAARAELDQARTYRTLGGPPRAPAQDWANATLPPPESATDPDAPEHRRPGFAGSRSHRNGTIEP